MNRLEIKGKENKDKIVDALLESGYQVLVSMDMLSRTLPDNGVYNDVYLINYTHTDYDGTFFYLLDENRNPVE